MARGLTAWGAAHFSRPSWEVVELSRPASGWSNETIVVTARLDIDTVADERLVVRMPPILPVFPSHDVLIQAGVLEALASEAVPVPRVVAVETDEQWIGSPFLVMSFEPGHPGPEVATLDPWLADAPADRQRHLHEAFVETMAAVHRVDWRRHGLGGILRGTDGHDSLAAEVEWWVGYLQWATDGAPPSLLADAMEWCQATRPAAGEASLCWGDARIGNVMISDGYEILSVLDWEGASIGPREMDLGWYLALEGLVEKFTGRTVPGFLPHREVIARYEEQAGRAVAHIGWHEIFALSRSAAISERLARLSALGAMDYPADGGDESPVLLELARRIDTFDEEDR
jgi:aminoglycoside phosphotransferase (APT) family kinase protein